MWADNDNDWINEFHTSGNWAEDDNPPIKSLFAL